MALPNVFQNFQFTGANTTPTPAGQPNIPGVTRLTGQAALDYINSGRQNWQGVGFENPNYDPMLNGMPQFGQPNQLMSSGLGGTINDLLTNLLNIPLRPLQITGTLMGGNNTVGANIPSPWDISAAKKADIKAITENPLGEYLKSGAGIASLLVPGGGGLLANLGKLGLAGSLYGVSQNKNPEEMLADIAKYGLAGMAGGAVLGAGSKLLGKAVSKIPFEATTLYSPEKNALIKALTGGAGGTAKGVARTQAIADILQGIGGRTKATTPVAETLAPAIPEGVTPEETTNILQNILKSPRAPQPVVPATPATAVGAPLTAEQQVALKTSAALNKDISAGKFGEVPIAGEAAPKVRMSDSLESGNIIRQGGVQSAYMQKAMTTRLNRLTDVGAKLSPGESNLTPLGKRAILEKVQGVKEISLRATGRDVPIGSLPNKILSGVKDLVKDPRLLDNPAWVELETRVGSLKNFADTADLLNWFDRITTKYAGRGDETSVLAKRILDGGREVLSNQIKGVSPAIRQDLFDLFTINSAIHGLDAIQNASSKSYISSPFGVGLPAKTEAPIQAVKSVLAQKVIRPIENLTMGATGGGAGLGGVGTAMATGAESAGLGGRLNNLIGNRGMAINPGALAAIMMNKPLSATSQASANTNAMNNLLSILQGAGGTTAGTAGLGGTTGTGINQSAVNSTILGLVSAGMKPADIKTLLELLGVSPTGGATATQKKQMADIENSYTQVDNLKNIIDQNSAYFGRIQGGDIGNLFTTIFPDATRKGIQTRLEMVGQNLSKALEGSRLTDADREFYRKRIIAMLNQTPDEAKSVIDEIEQVLQSQYETYSSAYQ